MKMQKTISSGNSITISSNCWEWGRVYRDFWWKPVFGKGRKNFMLLELCI